VVMMDEPWDAAKQTVPTDQMIGHGTAAGIQTGGVKIVPCLSYLMLFVIETCSCGVVRGKVCRFGNGIPLLISRVLLVHLRYFCPPTAVF
jgi:hypothetical protein